MRFAFLILIITVICYVLYQSTDAAVRKNAIKKITYHGIRLIALVAALALIMAAAYYLPVSSILI